MGCVFMSAYHTAHNVDTINRCTSNCTKNHHVSVGDSKHTTIKCTSEGQRSRAYWSVFCAIQVDGSCQATINVGMTSLNHVSKPTKFSSITQGIEALLVRGQIIFLNSVAEGADTIQEVVIILFCSSFGVAI